MEYKEEMKPHYVIWLSLQKVHFGGFPAGQPTSKASELHSRNIRFEILPGRRLH